MGLMREPENGKLQVGLAIAEATRARVVQECKCRAEEATACGDYKLAVTHLMCAVKHNPDDQTLRTLLDVSQAHAAVDSHTDGFDSALSVEANNLKRAGEAAFAQLQYAAAITHFSAAAKLDPTDHLIEEALEVAISAQTSRVAELTRSAEDHLAAQQFNECINDLESATQVNPNDVQVQSRLAVARAERLHYVSKLQSDAEHFLSSEKYIEAVDCFNAALRLEPRMQSC